MAKLHFYYSAMNAGKTTTLLQASYNYQERGMKTVLYKPKFDTRDSQTMIKSRIGLQEKAILFSKKYNFFESIEKETKQNKNNINCILVDEAQFLSKEQVIHLSRIVDELSIPVLCYGLRTDFLGKLFEGSQYLLGIADSLTEIKTICHCGSKASMNLRVDCDGNPVKDGEQIEVGGNDRYIAVCRKHFSKALSEVSSEIIPIFKVL